MSAIRISRPGIPGTTLIDQGPSNSGTRTYIGGTLVTGESGTKRVPPPLPSVTPERRAQMAAYRARKDIRCGARMRTHDTCARTLGHRGDHMGSEALERQAMRRRSAA